jgi:hypothetical protein
MANAVDQMPKIWTSASQNVLIEDKKRLDGSNLSLKVLQYKIQIFELGMDRIVYRFAALAYVGCWQWADEFCWCGRRVYRFSQSRNAVRFRAGDDAKLPGGAKLRVNQNVQPAVAGNVRRSDGRSAPATHAGRGSMSAIGTLLPWREVGYLVGTWVKADVQEARITAARH